MKFVQYIHRESAQWGVERNGSIYRLSDVGSGDPTYGDFTNASFLDRIERAIADDRLASFDAADVRLLAPVRTPGKLICVGLNYHDHAEEQDEEIPERPLLFAKSPSSVTNPGDPIVHPPDVEQVDYEVELAAVIGRTAKDVPAEAASEYIAGYTIMNDVSARDAQFEDGQFFRGKSYDSFAPLGPTLATGADIDPNDLALGLSVDGETKQQSSTTEFIFPIESVVEYVSGVMTLEPGDVISTGTPGGVGIFREPPDLLEPGDTVDAWVESIGTLTNTVVEPSSTGSRDRP